MKIVGLGLLAVAFMASPVMAEDAPADTVYTLIIKDHTFTPDKLEVPVGKKFRITVDNQDATAEEFESLDLKREKVIAGKSKGVVLLGPLNAGEYAFTGEYHADTAMGKIVAK